MELTARITDRLAMDDASKAAWRTAALAFAASRLVLLLVGWLTLSFIATHGSAPHGVAAPFGAMRHLVCQWDCGWYMTIARHGYSVVSSPQAPYATNFAFWPAFPYLARYLHAASGLSLLASGVVLVNLALLLALYFLCKYCLTLGMDRRTATFAALLLAFAPQGFLFSVFYADALTLLGIIGAMYHARVGRWWIAGLFAILASSSRPTGIVVLVFLLVCAYQTLGWRNFLRPWMDSRPFIPIVLAPAGHFLAMWMAFRVSGDAFAEVHTRAQGVGWMVHFIAPWWGLLGDFHRGPDLVFWTFAALALAISIVPLVRQRWWPDAAFAICYFLLIFSQSNPEGLLQYAVVLPTIYVGFAWLFRRSELARLVLLGVFGSTGAALFCAWALGVGIAV